MPGSGLPAGSRAQHVAGFRSALQVHRAFPPDVEDRAGLHEALRLVGMGRRGLDRRARQRSSSTVFAFDWATERMRAADVSVPRDVLGTRPDPEPLREPFGDEGGEVRRGTDVAVDAPTTGRTTMSDRIEHPDASPPSVEPGLALDGIVVRSTPARAVACSPSRSCPARSGSTASARRRCSPARRSTPGSGTTTTSTSAYDGDSGSRLPPLPVGVRLGLVMPVSMN